MKRREFIAGLGVVVAWPLVAQAQQPIMPAIGFLSGVSPGPLAQRLAAFHRGLKETGNVEGQNVAIEYRWAEGQYDRLPALATNLISREVVVIVAYTDAAALAAKAATTTIPIVFLSGSDPVRAGKLKNSTSSREGTLQFPLRSKSDRWCGAVIDVMCQNRKSGR